MYYNSIIRFIKISCLMSALLMLFPQCAKERNARPNILFVISDDQSYEDTSINGSQFVQTPGFDTIARKGVLFKNAFVTTPSCNPSRGSILTGMPFYRLKEASMNHKNWPTNLTVYTDILIEAGYHTGYTGKGCGPTNWKAAGRKTNPAGPVYNRMKATVPNGSVNNSNIDYAANFKEFLSRKPEGAPFCFWFGAVEPHRIFKKGIGRRSGKKLTDASVPPFLPNMDEVREDLINYAAHIEWFDSHLKTMIDYLEKIGEMDNTLIVVTGDNGMAFPRAKATCYDSGTHVPLAIRWDEKIRPGRVVSDFVSLSSLAPTFLEAAGLNIPENMTGKSLIPILKSEKSGQVDENRSFVITGLERHFPGGRIDGSCYPIRAIRTGNYLYIHNLESDRWPVGDPEAPVWPNDDDTGGYGDIDGSPSKSFLFHHEDQFPELFKITFGKRPAEELYDVINDPYQLTNIADKPQYESIKNELAKMLSEELKNTGDPRSFGGGDVFERYSHESMIPLN
jgi:uncharacterized sulfatase